MSRLSEAVIDEGSHLFMNEGSILVHQSVEELMAETQTQKISDGIVTILKKMKSEA